MRSYVFRTFWVMGVGFLEVHGISADLLGSLWVG